MTTSPPTDRTPEFLALLGQCDRRLLAYVLSLAPNWHEAEEIMQKVRLRLWEQFATHYTPGTNFHAWAKTVAMYLAKAHLDERRRRSFSQATLDHIAEIAAEEESHPSLRHEALLHCLQQLDDRKRGMVRLYYQGREPLEAVAQQLGRSLDSLRKSLYRTRRSLAECIEAYVTREQRP